MGDSLELPADVGDLLFPKRHELAKATEGDVEKLLFFIQVDDGLPGRLSESEIQTIHEKSSGRDQAERLVTVVASSDRATHLRFLYALYGVNSEVLDIVQTNLRATVSELFIETLMKIGPGSDFKGNLLLQKEFSSLKLWAKSELNIFLFGHPGVGKSALVNSLLGERVAPETADFYSSEEGSNPTCYKSTVKAIDVRVWDTPGFSDAEANSVTDIYPDLILFCIDLTKRLAVEDLKVVENVTRAYGTNEVWKNCLVVFTKANTLRSPDPAISDSDDIDADLLATTMTTRAAEVRDWMKKKAGLSQEDADAIPCVPAGSHRDFILADGKEWLPEFWASALVVAKGSSAGILLHCSEDRLKQTQPAAQKGGEVEQKIASDDPGGMPKAQKPLNLCRQQSKRVMKKVIEADRSWSLRRLDVKDVSKLSRLGKTLAEGAKIGLNVGRQLSDKTWVTGVCAIIGALHGVWRLYVRDKTN